jgi:hypothetical protein
VRILSGISTNNPAIPPFVADSYTSSAVSTGPINNTWMDVFSPPEDGSVYSVIAITSQNIAASGSVTYQLAIVDSAGTTVYLAYNHELASGSGINDAVLLTSEPIIITDGAVIQVRQTVGTADGVQIRFGAVRVV